VQSKGEQSAVSNTSFCRPIGGIHRRDDTHIKSCTLRVARDLRVVGRGTSNLYLPTLGSMFNPFGILEDIQAARHLKLRDIISGFEGVVKSEEILRECS
jgi:hypothetical protein